MRFRNQLTDDEDRKQDYEEEDLPLVAQSQPWIDYSQEFVNRQ